MGNGEEGGFGWCNVFIKFLLFLTNVVIWVSPALKHLQLTPLNLYELIEVCLYTLLARRYAGPCSRYLHPGRQ